MKQDADSTKNVKIMVPLKYVSSFRRTLKMPLTYCEIKLIPTWSKNMLEHLILLQIKQ